MKSFDIFLQNWRIDRAEKFIPPRSKILDIGCGDGRIFKRLNGRISGVGIDPALKQPILGDNFKLLPGYFPERMPEERDFDVITMLAVLEHFAPRNLKIVSEKCAVLLKKEGLLIITVPCPMIDHLLWFLRLLRWVDAETLEEHHGFRPSDTIPIFSEYFTLITEQNFQLGLNHLYVFKRLNREIK
jgi:SAM-dependent methyltransferase